MNYGEGAVTVTTAFHDDINRRIGEGRMILRWWAPLCAVLVVAVGGLLLGLVAQSHATAAAQKAAKAGAEARATVACVNRILAGRGPLTNSDTIADLAFLKAVVTVFNDRPGSKQQIADGEALKRQAILSYGTKNANQLTRLAHPLGLC
jgi:hypothetical protein